MSSGINIYHLFETEGANAREVSVGDVPVVNECHAEFLGFVNAHLTTSHQQHSLPRRARHLVNNKQEAQLLLGKGDSTPVYQGQHIAY